MTQGLIRNELLFRKLHVSMGVSSPNKIFNGKLTNKVGLAGVFRQKISEDPVGLGDFF